MKKKSSIKIGVILRWALIAIISIAVGLGAYSWNAKSLANDALPMPLGVGVAVVLSGSMEPALSVGDLLILKEAEDYRAGDVVVYQSGSMPVVHRIVDIADGMVTTRGDANNVSDGAIALSQVKGKVIAHIPHVGKIVRLLKTPVATVALIVGAVLSIELPFLKEKEKKDEELERIKEEIRRLKEEQEK